MVQETARLAWQSLGILTSRDLKNKAVDWNNLDLHGGENVWTLKFLKYVQEIIFFFFLPTCIRNHMG